MLAKEPSNKILYREIKKIREVALKNQDGIKRNRKAIGSVKDVVLKNKKEISRLGETVGSLFGLYFNMEKRMSVVEEKVAFIPKMYDNVDKIMGIVVAFRQEGTFMSARIEDHEDRITTLEKHTP